MYKKRFFIRHLLTIIIPLFIPVAVLGIMAYYSSQHDVRQELDHNSYQLLSQSKKQLDMVMEEIDTLKLTLFNNARVFNELTTILQSEKYTYESSLSYQIISNYLYAITSAKPYIHSIYFYSNNKYERFLSSREGISTLSSFVDTEWYTQFMEKSEVLESWISKRSVKFYHFAQEEELLTINYQISPQKIGIFLNIKPKFIEDILINSSSYPDQATFIADADGQILFTNHSQISNNELPLQEIMSKQSPNFSIEVGKNQYLVIKMHSDRYNWDYISLIPHHSIYATPNRILRYTIGFSLISLVCGLLLAYYFTNRNYRQLVGITNILRSAEHNRHLTKPSERYTDEYSYILQSMIQHFIEHHYVTTQLSEKKFRLEVAEMKALQSQIKPHFLYNTLNSIYWESVKLTGKPNQASEMIEYLSDMLSYSINHSETIVSWEDELNNTRNYMAIQKLRYGDKFTFITEYDEEMLNYRTLKLLLQPIIENSIYHGLQPKESNGGIKIKFSIVQDTIHVRCIDSGVGMTKEKLAQLRARMYSSEENFAEHVGLVNTYRRLQLICEDKANIMLYSKVGWGTIIHISYPLL